MILAAYALGNVHLMLLSCIGRPYDPATGEGVVGRNYAYQIGSGATVFFDENTYMNPYMGAGALHRGGSGCAVSAQVSANERKPAPGPAGVACCPKPAGYTLARTQRCHQPYFR